jgi:hypothetical protein
LRKGDKDVKKEDKENKQGASLIFLEKKIIAKFKNLNARLLTKLA